VDVKVGVAPLGCKKILNPNLGEKKKKEKNLWAE
jgi:hypothetical protein